MVQSDACDHAAIWGDYVGGVEFAAKTHFKGHPIAPCVPPAPKTHRRLKLELGYGAQFGLVHARCDRDQGLHKPRELVVGNRLPSQLNPLGDVVHIRTEVAPTRNP